MTHHWFIGDIHGCLDALERLEARAVKRSEHHGADVHFVSVGDLVDRGPDSAGVVRHFRVGDENGTHSAILGNHEEMFLRVVQHFRPDQFESFSPWVATGDLYRGASRRADWLSIDDFHEMSRLMWLAQGGTPTLKSFGVNPFDSDTWRLPLDDMKWLCGLGLLFECDTAVATHALIDADDLAVLRGATGVNEHIRDVVSGAMWRRALPEAAPDPRPHVSGHTPLKSVRRYKSRQIVRVDTGCFMGQRLSAWCPELDAVLSVPMEA